MESAQPYISFCTSCHNRAHQLKYVFERNSDIIGRSADCEWVIFDYCSDDDLEPFMRARLPGCSVNVRYINDYVRRPWHMSVAKNIAHRLARGDVLVNLDCDNFIDDARTVAFRYFSSGCQVLHLWSGRHRDGTCGRIAVSKSVFTYLKGYDESFFPMGYQDLDFLARASAAGFAVLVHHCQSGSALENTRQESVRNCSPKGQSWIEYDRGNRLKSFVNIRSGNLSAKNDWQPLCPTVRTGQIPLRNA